MTEGFVKELEATLAREELVKIRVVKNVEVDLEELARKAKAELVVELGHTAIFYRAAQEPKLVLPD